MVARQESNIARSLARPANENAMKRILEVWEAKFRLI